MALFSFGCTYIFWKYFTVQIAMLYTFRRTACIFFSLLDMCSRVVMYNFLPFLISIFNLLCIEVASYCQFSFSEPTNKCLLTVIQATTLLTVRVVSLDIDTNTNTSGQGFVVFSSCLPYLCCSYPIVVAVSKKSQLHQ